MNGISKRRLLADLTDKEARDVFVEEHVRTGPAYQIKALRNARGWSQEELGRRLSKPQSVVARLENPDYGKFSLNTLLEVASAFDVGLMLRFVSFGELVDRCSDLTPATLNVPSFGSGLVESESSDTPRDKRWFISFDSTVPALPDNRLAGRTPTWSDKSPSVFKTPRVAETVL